MTGFLPPEDGSGRGQGYIEYTIEPSSSVTTGTEIRNVALIRFDFAEVIATNQIDPHDPDQGVDTTKEALNTIDATPPVSHVLPLPATSPGTFQVSWAGDDGAGSGIATYDVYVSDNGGPFLDWQTAVTTTLANFTGADGHTYGFYSVATDNVGYRESTPSAAQASTTVDAPLAVTLASFDAIAEADHILVTWETVSEINNSGFNLYRAVSDDWSSATLLAYVPSQAPGSTQGFAYSFTDDDVLPGQSYWYWLEDIDLSGRPTLHGPITITLLPPTAVTIAAYETGSPERGLAVPPVLLLLIGVALALAGISASRRRSAPC